MGTHPNIRLDVWVTRLPLIALSVSRHWCWCISRKDPPPKIRQNHIFFQLSFSQLGLALGFPWYLLVDIPLFCFAFSFPRFRVQNFHYWSPQTPKPYQYESAIKETRLTGSANNENHQRYVWWTCRQKRPSPHAPPTTKISSVYSRGRENYVKVY